MRFTHVHAAPIPEGFVLCQDGVLAIDDPSLTSLVKVEGYVVDEDSAKELEATSRWHPSLGKFIALKRFAEWSTHNTEVAE